MKATSVRKGNILRINGILFKVMKEKGTHEGCIEQLDVLYDILYGGKADGVAVDRLRHDLVDADHRRLGEPTFLSLRP